MMKHSTDPGRAAPISSPKLRTPDAARHVGLAPATLSKLRCIGGGPTFIKLGRAVVYDVAALDASIAAQGERRATVDQAEPEFARTPAATELTSAQVK